MPYEKSGGGSAVRHNDNPVERECGAGTAVPHHFRRHELGPGLKQGRIVEIELVRTDAHDDHHGHLAQPHGKKR